MLEYRLKTCLFLLYTSFFVMCLPKIALATLVFVENDFFGAALIVSTKNFTSDKFHQPPATSAMYSRAFIYIKNAIDAEFMSHIRKFNIIFIFQLSKLSRSHEASFQFANQIVY